MRRRDFFKKVAGTGVIATFLGLVGCGQEKINILPAQQPPYPETGSPAWFRKLIEDVNRYFYAVFTYKLSLLKRRCLEVTEEAIRYESYSIIAILNNQLKDFRILECEIEDTFGKVKYEATFCLGKNKVEKHISTFYFQLLGGPGDPVWIEYVKAEDSNVLVYNNKMNLLRR